MIAFRSAALVTVMLAFVSTTASAQDAATPSPEQAPIASATTRIAGAVETAAADSELSFEQPFVIPDAPKRPSLLLGLYAGAGTLQGLDFYTTRRGMQAGAWETNDAVRTDSNGTTLALKAGMTAAAILIAEKMWKKNRKMALGAMIAQNLITGLVVANNYRVIGQAERRAGR